MNAARILSALAALAVGFGITLVGVNVTDDSSDSMVTSVSTEPATVDDSGSADDSGATFDEAQQDEAAAEPPPDAEVVDDVDQSVSTGEVATPRDTNAPRPSDEVDATIDESSAGEFFPCSDDAFESLIDELDPLEATELIAEADVFLRVVAKSLAGFGSASVDEWENDLEAQFDRFVAPEGCTAAIDEIFVEGSDGFFCAAANVSADPRLFVYLSDIVPGQMERCPYIQEEGAN